MSARWLALFVAAALTGPALAKPPGLPRDPQVNCAEGLWQVLVGPKLLASEGAAEEQEALPSWLPDADAPLPPRTPSRRPLLRSLLFGVHPAMELLRIEATLDEL